jgi:hypothetical protein
MHEFPHALPAEQQLWAVAGANWVRSIGALDG